MVLVKEKILVVDEAAKELKYLGVDQPSSSQ